MSSTDYAPSPGQAYQWGVRRRNSAQGLARNTAQTQFDRGGIHANRRADTQKLGQQFMTMRNKLPEQYARRGLQASGIYGQGLQDYGTQRNQAFGDLSRRYQQMLGQTNLNEVNYNQDYVNQQSDIATEEAMRRAQLAAQLRSVM